MKTKFKQMIYKIAKLIILALIFLSPVFVFSLPLEATISQPDSTPSLSDIHINFHLITTGDALIYGKYYLPYASPPTTYSSEAFMFVLLDTDNVTILGTVTPYVYFNYGYNYGCFSFYIESGIVSGTPYKIRIVENPTQFDSPVNVDQVLTTTQYTTKTTQSDNQIELGNNIISIAQELNLYYTTYTLTEPAAGGTVLASPQGETYFRGAIPGLQVIAPSIFLVGVQSEDLSSDNWTTAQFDAYAANMSSGWVGTSVNATSSQFHVTTGMVMGMIAILPLIIGAVIVSQQKYQRGEPGLVAGAVILCMGGFMGWIPLAVFASIMQVFGIYIAYLWFFARG